MYYYILQDVERKFNVLTQHSMTENNRKAMGKNHATQTVDSRKNLYCIAGNFGEVFNLAILIKIAKFKFANTY